MQTCANTTRGVRNVSPPAPATRNNRKRATSTADTSKAKKKTQVDDSDGEKNTVKKMVKKQGTKAKWVATFFFPFH